MDIAGAGAAPERKHVLQAAKAAGLPVKVAEEAIDELLCNATPQLLLELAKALPLSKTTLEKVHKAMQVNYARLSQ
jgi:serine/threonine-protein kinase HipA